MKASRLTHPAPHSRPTPDAAEADYQRYDVLPAGIVRVADGAIGAERLLKPPRTSPCA